MTRANDALLNAVESSARPRASGHASASASASAPADIIAVILDREHGLSRTNRRIAQAILTDPKSFVEKPVEELVSLLNVSAPTITRFARSVGCEGLRDLKLKVMGSMRVGMRYLEPTTPPASLDDVADRVVQRAQRAVANSRQGIDIPRTELAIKALASSRTVYAFGTGGVSSWLVQEIQNRFFRLGMRVVPSADHQMQMMLAATAERGDVVLCCSLSGNNPELLRVIDIARGYGATTIGLAQPATPLAEAVEIHIPVHAVDDGDVLGPTSMRYAFMIVIDVLAYGTAIRGSSAAREKLRRIKQQFTNFRDVDDTQPMCD